MNFQELNEKFENFDPNDIDWNNMGSWPLAGRVFFAMAVFICVLVAGYLLDIQDLSARHDSIVREEDQLKEAFERKAFKVANLEGYKKQLTEIEESFGSLLRQLPRDTEVPGLLEDITHAAIGASLEIKSIKLEDEIETEFYTELPIRIDVIGEYHDFGTFVSSVAALGRIVTLHDFEVVSAKVADENQLNLKILAKTYRYNDKDSKKVKTKPKGKGGRK